MNPSPPPKIALIGCGVWGRNHARSLHQAGALSGIIDAHAAETAAQYNVPLFTDLPNLLQNEPPDALVIASPDVTHHALAIEALEAGLDIFVEKPLAMNMAQAREICALAQKQTRVLMVGHLLHYHPAFQTLLQAVREDKIGAVRNIISIRHDVFERPRDHDLIWGYGPHDASMVTALVGEAPLEAVSFYGDPMRECLLFGHFQTGIQANISLSWQSPKKRLLVVSGTGGQLVFDDARSDGEKILMMTVESGVETLTYESHEPLRTELDHFIDCIRTRKTPLTGADEALRTTALLDACAHISQTWRQTDSVKN